MLKDFKTFQLATEYYQICKGLRLPHYLKEQLLRAASSMALNIAEGSAKRTPEDQRRYYFNALGSLRETQAILTLERIQNKKLDELGNQLGACLFRLCHPSKHQSELQTKTQTGPQTPV